MLESFRVSTGESASLRLSRLPLNEYRPEQLRDIIAFLPRDTQTLNLKGCDTSEIDWTSLPEGLQNLDVSEVDDTQLDTILTNSLHLLRLTIVNSPGLRSIP